MSAAYGSAYGSAYGYGYGHGGGSAAGVCGSEGACGGWQWDDECGEWVWPFAEEESPAWWQHDTRGDFDTPVKQSRTVFREHPRAARRRAADGDTMEARADLRVNDDEDDDLDEDGIVENLVDMVDHLLQSQQKQQDLVVKLLKRCAGDAGHDDDDEDYLAATPPAKSRRRRAPSSAGSSADRQRGRAGKDDGADLETEYDEDGDDRSCSFSSSSGPRNSFAGSPLGSKPSDVWEWPMSRNEKKDRAHDLGKQIWKQDRKVLAREVEILQQQVDKYESARGSKMRKA